eukprot:762435-Hanusia_phi.AAC.2
MGRNCSKVSPRIERWAATRMACAHGRTQTRRRPVTRTCCESESDAAPCSSSQSDAPEDGRESTYESPSSAHARGQRSWRSASCRRFRRRARMWLWSTDQGVEDVMCPWELSVWLDRPPS